MVKKKETKEDKRAYLSIGIVFIIVGATFLINEPARSLGFVFAILGVTFLILGLDKKSKKDT